MLHGRARWAARDAAPCEQLNGRNKERGRLTRTVAIAERLNGGLHLRGKPAQLAASKLSFDGEHSVAVLSATGISIMPTFRCVQNAMGLAGFKGLGK